MTIPPRNTDAAQMQAAERAAVAFFGASQTELSAIESIPPGCSGALVFRMQERDGRSHAIKRWPLGTKPTRINEVHRVMIRARQQGCEFVPEPRFLSEGTGTCWITPNDGCWDACQWMPGQSLPHHERDTTGDSVILTDSYLNRRRSTAREGGRVIARFHQAFADQARHAIRTPAIEQRIQRIHELQNQLPMVLNCSNPDGLLDMPVSQHEQLRSVFLKTCNVMRMHWPSWVQGAIADLNHHRDQPTLQQLVLRDVHLDHMLFHWPENRPADSLAMNIHAEPGSIPSRSPKPPRKGSFAVQDADPTIADEPKASGLVDYDAIRVDSPATDLARWVSSFTLPLDVQVHQTSTLDQGLSPSFDHQIWESAVAGYQEIRTFSDQQADLGKTLADTGICISLANWLTWLALEKRRFPGGAEAIRTRMTQLLNRLILGNLPELPREG